MCVCVCVCVFFVPDFSERKFDQKTSTREKNKKKRSWDEQKKIPKKNLKTLNIREAKKKLVGV